MTTFAQCAIAGHLYDKVKKKDVVFAEIRLLGFPRKYNTSTYSDSLGNYYTDNIPERKHTFYFSSREYNDTTVYNITFVKDSTTNVDILYPTYCEFSEKKSKCPICLKKDKVIPILYGYPSEKMRQKRDKGKIRLGGCMVTNCDPKWFCTRDDQEF